MAGNTNSTAIFGQVEDIITPDTTDASTQVCSATFSAVKPWKFSHCGEAPLGPHKMDGCKCIIINDMGDCAGPVDPAYKARQAPCP